MVSAIDYIRAWENRVGTRTIHMDIKELSKEETSYLTNQYHLIADNIDLNNKTIIDYGCGGGLFGMFLYSWEYNLKKYIGIDIADRCIVETRLNNVCWENKNDVIIDIIKINPIELIDLKKLKGNVLVILNVIRFLPDKEYLKLFFNMINKSGIKDIILNFNLGSEDTFRKQPYKTTHDIGKANELTMKTILELTNNYKVSKMKNIKKDCYLFLKKKTNRKRTIKEEVVDNPISD